MLLYDRLVFKNVKLHQIVDTRTVVVHILSG